MASIKKIDAETLTVIGAGTIEGNVLKLPGTLDRADYVRVDKVLKGLGGKWDRKAGGHVFPFDPRELLGEAAETGAYTDRKQAGQMFWTPEDLAERMAELASISSGAMVLEPSAGIGRLVKPLLARGAHVVAIEQDHDNGDVLKRECRPGAWVAGGDFLGWASVMRPEFDAVVMNPPFSDDQDIAHIRAAWGLLKVGGRMVAICGAGAFDRTIGAAPAFRAWIAEIGATVEALPRGTFRESGTNVSTMLVSATKASAKHYTQENGHG